MLEHETAARCPRGFTLIELMVTLAVAAILMTTAVPAFNNIIESNTITVARNKLIGALSFTRSAAVKQGRTVTLCKSADGQSCTTNGDWSQGWIIYSPEAGISTSQLLRVESGLDPQITITGNTKITKDISYDAMGFTIGENGHWTITHTGSGDIVKVYISNVGRVRIETP